VATTQLARHVLFPVADLPDGETRIVVVRGRSIGVVRAGDRYFALRNVCPHHGAPLCRGTVNGTMLPSARYTYDYDPDAWTMRCPWHGHEFRLDTGEAVTDPARMRVRVYRVEVEDGQVVLYV
jgi:3-phenylpropionate/trans-cinnamate dioxygenase ferredoxin subunit